MKKWVLLLVVLVLPACEEPPPGYSKSQTFIVYEGTKPVFCHRKITNTPDRDTGFAPGQVVLDLCSFTRHGGPYFEVANAVNVMVEE